MGAGAGTGVELGGLPGMMTAGRVGIALAPPPTPGSSLAGGTPLVPGGPKALDGAAAALDDEATDEAVAVASGGAGASLVLRSVMAAGAVVLLGAPAGWGWTTGPKAAMLCGWSQPTNTTASRMVEVGVGAGMPLDAVGA